MTTRKRPVAIGLALVLTFSLIAIYGVGLNRHANPPTDSPRPAIATAPLVAAPTFSPTLLGRGFSFVATGAMSSPRQNASVTLLASGFVLVAGGSIYSPDGDTTLASAELYNPATGKFSPTGSLSTPRDGATSTALPDGRVLIAGGSQRLNQNPWHQDLSSAEIYNPASGTFSPTGALAVAHDLASATLLSNRQVLIFGGQSDLGTDTWDAELYNPASGSFTTIGNSLVSSTGNRPGLLLPDGRVLSFGQSATDPDSNLVVGQLYDPITRTFSLSADSSIAQGIPVTTALLPDGNVLVVGANNATDNQPQASRAQIYHPVSDTYTATGPLAPAEDFHQAITLSSGRVLLLGAVTPDMQMPIPTDTVVLYDPATNAFTTLPGMAQAHAGGLAITLNDGRALIAGGNGADFAGSSANAELLRGDS